MFNSFKNKEKRNYSRICKLLEWFINIVFGRLFLENYRPIAI